MFLPEGDDPDTLVRREGQVAFEQRLGQATPLADYLFAELRRQTDSETLLESQARLADSARPLLEKLPDGHFRDLMEERLKKEAHLPVTRLRPPPVTITPNRADDNLRLAHTPLRKAIALLLYRPALAQQATDADILALRTGGGLGEKLLANAIAVLRSNPQITVAALLERYRDTREGAILERLAIWDPEGPEQVYQFEQEFSDILASLRRRDDPWEQLPEMLLRCGTPKALSTEEREVVQNCVSLRKSNSKRLSD